MQILNSTHTSFHVATDWKNKLGVSEPGTINAKEEAVPNAAQSPTASAVTGLATSLIADDTVSAAIQQSQQVTQFEKLNFVSEGDRKLFKAMTGYSVSRYGKVTDKNGNIPLNMDNLSNHTLVTFNMELQSARHGQSTTEVVPEDRTG